MRTVGVGPNRMGTSGAGRRGWPLPLWLCSTTGLPGLWRAGAEEPGLAVTFGLLAVVLVTQELEVLI